VRVPVACTSYWEHLASETMLKQLYDAVFEVTHRKCRFSGVHQRKLITNFAGTLGFEQ